MRDATGTVGWVCGRFVSSNSPAQIAAYFGAAFDETSIDDAHAGPNFNTAPTNDILGVVEDATGSRTVESYRWGLIPSWAKDLKIGSKMINARAETLAEKPVFKGLMKKHRLIIPMEGFYEWQAVAGQTSKQPMFIYRVNGEPLAVAGLWATWRDPAQRSDGDGAPVFLHSCTIITTAANATMAPVHDRMPALLPASAWTEWLDIGQQDLVELQRLLVPAPDDVLSMHPVSTAVNAVRNKGNDLIVPIG